MTTPKPFKYRTRPIAPPDVNRGRSVQRNPANEEYLTGFIGDQKASDLEERFARALDKLGAQYSFRVTVTQLLSGRRTLVARPGRETGDVEIDHLATYNGRTVPVFIDGQISHYMAPWMLDRDKEKADIVTKFGRGFGWMPAVRIPFWQLTTQAMADRKALEVFG